MHWEQQQRAMAPPASLGRALRCRRHSLRRRQLLLQVQKPAATSTPEPEPRVQLGHGCVIGDNCSVSRKLDWKPPMFAGRMLQKTPNASYTPQENGQALSN